MKKSNFLRVGIAVGSALFSVQAVHADATGVTTTAPTSSQQNASAPTLGASWSAPVKSTLPTLQSVMHLTANQAPPPPVKPLPAAGQVNLSTNIMCGDQDVNNFAGGVNPAAPACSHNVQFLNPSANGSKPQIQLVFGYWVVPQATVTTLETAVKAAVASGGTVSNTVSNAVVPGELGGPTWYPLAFDTMNVASATATNPPVVNQLKQINKSNGPQRFGSMIQTDVSTVLASIGGGSFTMPGATPVKYAVYFDLMACNPPLTPLSGTNATGNLPDSLEIATFLASLSLTGGEAGCTGSGTCSIGYSLARGLQFGGTGAQSWTVNYGTNALWKLGNYISTNGALPTQAADTNYTQDNATLTGIQGAFTQKDCTQVPNEKPNGKPRWFEPFPMQVTCNVMNNFTTLLSSNSFGPLGTALMNAGIAQEAQNTLNAAQNTLQAKASCFTPGTEYIDPILASITFPFTKNAAGNLVLLAPGAMTHPEALFADINYKTDYCTADPSCTGSDFNTIFGMTAAPVASVLARNSSPYDDLGELLVPSANAMMMMLEGGSDVVTAKDTLALGTGMIKAGVPVTTAVYTGSLNGVPMSQSGANLSYYVPVTPGPSNIQIDPSGLLPNGLGLTINVRAMGTGSGCPVKYCEADGLPASTFLE